MVVRNVRPDSSCRGSAPETETRCWGHKKPRTEHLDNETSEPHQGPRNLRGLPVYQRRRMGVVEPRQASSWWSRQSKLRRNRVLCWPLPPPTGGQFPGRLWHSWRFPFLVLPSMSVKRKATVPEGRLVTSSLLQGVCNSLLHTHGTPISIRRRNWLVLQPLAQGGHRPLEPGPVQRIHM